MNKFSKSIKALRIAAKLTQNELAIKLGVARSTVGMYESGKREPDFKTLEAIASIFKVDMNILHGYSTLNNENIEDVSKIAQNTKIFTEIYKIAKEFTENEQLYLLDSVKSLKKHLKNKDSKKTIDNFDIDEELKSYRQELEHEKKIREESSALQNIKESS